MIKVIQKIDDSKVYRSRYLLDFNSCLETIKSKKPRGLILFPDGNKIHIKFKHATRELYKKTLTCSCCGEKGRYFVLERTKGNNSSFSFNLYTKDWVLMNIDHIFPASKGGRDIGLNYQLTCEHCNSDKGDRLEPIIYDTNQLKTTDVRELYFLGADKVVPKKYKDQMFAELIEQSDKSYHKHKMFNFVCKITLFLVSLTLGYFLRDIAEKLLT